MARDAGPDQSTDAFFQGNHEQADVDGAAGDDAEADATSVEGSPHRLSDALGTRLHAVSDLDGNAVVLWGEHPLVLSQRWNAASSTWVQLKTFENEALPADNYGPFLVDPNGSPYVGIRSFAFPDPESGYAELLFRRLDPTQQAWEGPSIWPSALGWYLNTQVAIDAEGNAHAFWRTETLEHFWSWMPVHAASWAPPIAFDEDYNLLITRWSSWMWFSRNEVAIRRFDGATEAWSEPTTLWAFSADLPLCWELVSAGRDGSALAVRFCKDGATNSTKVRRYDPLAETWLEEEALPDVSEPSATASSMGPRMAFSDPVQSFVWFPVPADDGGIDTHLFRYGDEQGWELSRVAHGLSSYDRIELVADDAGHVYGLAPGGLTRFDTAAAVWKDTAVPIGALKLAVSANCAFAVGWDSESHLHAYKSTNGEEWEPAQGLPSPSPSVAKFDVVSAGPDQALVVWVGTYGAESGTWAAFIQ